MPCAILRALAALLLLSAKLASAQQSLQTTTTTTLYSTTTVLTSTITITGDHSTSVSVTTETIATAIPAATGTMAYTGDVFQSAVLNSTNYYRAQHQAGSLSWDDSLAQYAQDYAEKCQWKHSVRRLAQTSTTQCVADVYSRTVPTARTSPKATPAPRSRSTPGRTRRSTTITPNRVSTSRRATSPNWSGRTRPRSGAGRCSVPATRRTG